VIFLDLFQKLSLNLRIFYFIQPKNRFNYKKSKSCRFKIYRKPEKINTMKKILQITVILFASILMSCSDNLEDDSKDSVVGTWKLYHYTERDGERFPYPDCFSNSSFIFKSGGAGIVKWYVQDASKNCAIVETVNFEWKYEGIKAYVLKGLDDNEETYFIMNDTKTELTHYEDSKYGPSGYSDTLKKQ
jgi:hypothetical protein